MQVSFLCSSDAFKCIIRKGVGYFVSITPWHKALYDRAGRH